MQALIIGLYLLGGKRVLAAALLGGVLVFLILMGSLIGAAALDRTPIRHATTNVFEPQRDAAKVREEALHQLGLGKQQEAKRNAVQRDWQKVREEQLRQLGLDRQRAGQGIAANQ